MTDYYKDLYEEKRGEILDEGGYVTAINENVPDDPKEHFTKRRPTKYHRRISHKDGWSDVYDVLFAYDVVNPAIAHAIKKMLCAGTRGYKDFEQDVQEAIDSLERAKDFLPVPF